MLYLSIAKLYKLDGRSALLSPKAMSLVQKETESHYLGKLTPEIRKKPKSHNRQYDLWGFTPTRQLALNILSSAKRLCLSDVSEGTGHFEPT